MELLVRLADGTARSARAMMPWRPLAYPRARIEWCVAVAEPTVVLLAVRARGASRVVGARAPDVTILEESHARGLVEEHGGAARLMEDAPLGWDLAAKGFLRDNDVASFLSMQYRVPMINLEEYDVADEIIALLAVEVCTKHLVLPVSRAGDSLIVAMVDPSDHFALDAVAAATGFKVEPVIAPEAAIRAAIARYYPSRPHR